jgi:membrane protein implicated in regulation of membrane protease activity
MTLLFWIVIVLFCLAVEVHTNAFVGLFIGIGATLAFLLALLRVPFALQAVAWLAVSGAMILFLRPFALRKFHNRPYEVDMTRPTSNTMTNLTGFVEMTVGNEKHPGRVKIQGESWKAVTNWPEAIPDGAQVVVRKAYGTTLWVDPV